MTKLKLMAIAVAMATMSGCAWKDSTIAVALGTPTAEECATFANLGDKTIAAGEKAEVAQQTALTGVPLYAPLAAVAGAIQIGLSGGEALYKVGKNKYDEKCRGSVQAN